MDDCEQSVSYVSLAYSSNTVSKDSLNSLYDSKILITNEKEGGSNTNLTIRQEKKLKLKEKWRRMRNEFRVRLQMYDIYSYQRSISNREKPKQFTEETRVALKKGIVPLKLFIFRKHQKRKIPTNEIFVLEMIEETIDEHFNDEEIDKFEKRYFPTKTPVRRNSLEIYSEQVNLAKKYGGRILNNEATKKTKEKVTFKNIFGINFELHSKKSRQAMSGAEKLREIQRFDRRMMEKYRLLNAKISEMDDDQKGGNETDSMKKDMFLKIASKSMTGTTKGLKFVSRISVHKIKNNKNNFLSIAPKSLTSIPEESGSSFLKIHQNPKSEKQPLPHQGKSVNDVAKTIKNEHDVSMDIETTRNNNNETVFSRKIVQLTPAQIWKHFEEIDKITAIFVRKRQAFSNREDTFKDRLSREAKQFESIEKNKDFEHVYAHLIKRLVKVKLPSTVGNSY